MKRLCLALTMLIAVFGTSVAGAQPSGTTVTLNVPVSLTNIDPLVTSFGIDCNFAYSDNPAGVYVTGPGLAYRSVTVPLKAGAYTGAVPMTLTISSDPTKITGYWCRLWLTTPGGSVQPQQGSAGPAIAQAAPGTKFVQHIIGTFPSAPPAGTIPR
jgi:hypothetical protein